MGSLTRQKGGKGVNRYIKMLSGRRIKSRRKGLKKVLLISLRSMEKNRRVENDAEGKQLRQSSRLKENGKGAER